eukprot:7199563-Pyramimonas_sp.AAC.1
MLEEVINKLCRHFGFGHFNLQLFIENTSGARLCCQKQRTWADLGPTGVHVFNRLVNSEEVGTVRAELQQSFVFLPLAIFRKKRDNDFQRPH